MKFNGSTPKKSLACDQRQREFIGSWTTFPPFGTSQIIFFLRSLQSRIQSLEQDRLSTTTELYAKREECISINRELVAARELCLSLETRLAARESEIQLTKDVATQLEVEKSLRHRSEQREEEEKRERIAGRSRCHQS